MTTAATTALNRIADALEQIAMKPVFIDGSHTDKQATLDMIDAGWPPEERVWQFIINFPKEPTYEETFRIKLEDIARAIDDRCDSVWSMEPYVVCIRDAGHPGPHKGDGGGKVYDWGNYKDEPDTEPEEECVDVAEARRGPDQRVVTTHFYGDGCPEPHGEPQTSAHEDQVME